MLPPTANARRCASRPAPPVPPIPWTHHVIGSYSRPAFVLALALISGGRARGAARTRPGPSRHNVPWPLVDWHLLSRMPMQRWHATLASCDHSADHPCALGRGSPQDPAPGGRHSTLLTQIRAGGGREGGVLLRPAVSLVPIKDKHLELSKVQAVQEAENRRLHQQAPTADWSRHGLSSGPATRHLTTPHLVGHLRSLRSMSSWRQSKVHPAPQLVSSCTLWLSPWLNRFCARQRGKGWRAVE